MTRSSSLSHVAAPLLSLLLLAGCKLSVPVTDSSLTSAVQRRLSGDGALASEPIQTSVQAGIVTLTGSVSSDAARALAANDAAQVPGIKTVVNNLTVVTAALANPANLPAAPPPVTPEPLPPEPKVRPSRAATIERHAPRKSPSTDRSEAPVMQAPPSSPVANSSAPPAVVAPPPPAAPVARNVTIPAGTILPVRITQTLDSATTQQGETFSGTISSDVVIEGTSVLRQGVPVSGRVTAVQEAGHFSGNSLLSIELTGLDRRGQQVALTTEPYSTQGKGRGKNTAVKAGGGAAVGAILGGILGGGKGAAIGAAAGGGTGAGVNAITRGEQVQIPAETLVRFRLASPVTVRVSGQTGETDAPNPDLQRRPIN